MKPFEYNSNVSYNEQRKAAYHRNAKAALRALADALKLAPGSYDLRSNQGGIAVSGEITLHTETLYIQISQSCAGLPGILIRSCKGRKDYTGGTNSFAVADLLNDIPKLVKAVERCQARG